MKERIKKIRRELDLTQQEFADRLGVKRGAIANYEIGRNEPVDSIISLICREFSVNEEWLRTGYGEIFRASPTNELDALALKYNLTHRDYVFIEYLLKDVDARRAMENFCINFAAAALADDIPENTLAMPDGSAPALEMNVSELEERYIKSRSDSASKTTLSASSITEENEEKKNA